MRRSRSATKSCCSDGRARTRSLRRSGPTTWTRSVTRSCVASGRGSRGDTCEANVREAGIPPSSEPGPERPCGAENMSLLKRAAIAAGVVGGIAASAYAAERVAARRLRHRPDGDAQRALDAPIYLDHKLDTHDRGTIYVVENGNADDPVVVLSHGVTLSVRTWFHQLEELPKLGFRTI